MKTTYKSTQKQESYMSICTFRNKFNHCSACRLHHIITCTLCVLCTWTRTTVVYHISTVQSNIYSITTLLGIKADKHLQHAYSFSRELQNLTTVLYLPRVGNET